MNKLLHVSILLVLCAEFGSTSEYDHRYENNEEVSLWMNTANPNRNPQETYSYFSLPYCQGPKKSIHHYRKTLAEALLGVELQFSGLEIEFKSKIPKTTYCSIQLTSEKLQFFEYAIKNHFNYQMFLDDLSILGQVGEFDEFGESNLTYLYTHLKFDIGYNQNRIVDVNLTFSKEKFELKLIETAVEFSYEVNWVESNVKFEDRFEKYLDRRFFEYRIHWQSILGSGVLALVLVGIVGIILVKILKDSQDSRLQNIQEDVFRKVENPLVFSIFVANGCHIGIVTLFVIVLQIIFGFYESRGSTLSTIIYTYIVTSPINGFFGSQLYQTDGYKWIKQSILSELAFPGIISGITLGINFIFMYYHSSRVIHFITMMTVASIITFIILPLNLLGSFLARKLFGESNKIQVNIPENPPPRPIHKKSIFLNPLVLLILGGILSFGSILVEIYLILVSFWGYEKIYYLYSYTLVNFLILIIVTSCVAIICTYFLLKAEDYRWQWISFGLGGSTGVYVFLYSIFYFFFRTNMEGFMQIAFYFCNMALFSAALGVMCGTFAYVGTKIFVNKIYAKLSESNKNDEKVISGKGVFLVIQVL